MNLIAARESDQRRRVLTETIQVSEPEPTEPPGSENGGLYRQLLDSVPYPAMLVRSDHRVLAANRAAYGMGIGTAALCPQDESIVGGDGRPAEERECQSAGIKARELHRAGESLAAGQPLHREEDLGGRVWETWWMPLRDDVFLHCAFDITERRQLESEQERVRSAHGVHSQTIMRCNLELEEALTRAKSAEEALRERRDRAEEYLNIVGVMLAIVNTDENVALINRKGREILEYEEEELIGRNWFDTLVPRKRREETRKAFHRMLGGEEAALLDGEDSLVARHGDVKTIEFNSTAIRDRAGQVTGVLLSGKDVTELRRTRELLQHSQLLASLGEMTAGIAHEVNNPLGSILLYSELMATADVPPEIKKDLKVIHEEARRATQVMTDLLTYSRREKSSVRRLDLHRILRKMLDMRRYTERIRNISATTSFQEGPLHVRGDAPQLMQLFMNLMLNAEEALREAGGGHITISTCKEGDWARVSVSDNGIGIPPEDLGHVFYPFFTTRWMANGTGLGLSTCYGIATDHNGLIHAENNSTGGATFTVELPLAKGRQRQTRGAKMATAPKE